MCVMTLPKCCHSSNQSCNFWEQTQKARSVSMILLMALFLFLDQDGGHESLRTGDAKPQSRTRFCKDTLYFESNRKHSFYYDGCELRKIAIKLCSPQISTVPAKKHRNKRRSQGRKTGKGFTLSRKMLFFSFYASFALLQVFTNFPQAYFDNKGLRK